MARLAGLLLIAAAFVALPRPAAAQDSHVLVIVGLEGDDEHGARFVEWASVLVDTARTTFDVPPERSLVLADDPARAPDLIRGRSTKENIEAAVAEMAARAGAEDTVFVVLFGHGTSNRDGPRFNLPGPDLSAADFGAMLDAFPTQRIVFVNTTPSSGEFIEALAGPRRTVVTATRNASERFDTRFGGHFAAAFGSEEADTNKDRRVSVLEAFVFATAQVQRGFEEEGYLQTEHALLDDDGDGEGAREPESTRPDGRIAATLYLGERPLTTASGAPVTDPALRLLYEERRELERRLEELRAVKATMTPERYTAEFERLATELALKTRDIRQREAP